METFWTRKLVTPLKKVIFPIFCFLISFNAEKSTSRKTYDVKNNITEILNSYIVLLNNCRY